MDKALKQRMIGAIVLIALAVIFIPMLLDGSGETGTETVPLDIPDPPQEEFDSRLLPLGHKSPAPASNESETAGTGTVVRAAPPPEEPAAEPAGGAAAGIATSPNTQPVEPEPPSGEAVAAAPAESPPETAEETPAPTEPRKLAGGLTNWFVQVGSFARESNARDLRDRLREAGYSTTIKQVTVGGEVTHRVLVGPTMDESRAARLRDKIAARFGLNGIVIRG